jgi:hypothetical protein
MVVRNDAIAGMPPDFFPPLRPAHDDRSQPALGPVFTVVGMRRWIALRRLFEAFPKY